MGHAGKPVVVRLSVLRSIVSHEVFDELKQVDRSGHVESGLKHQGINGEFMTTLKTLTTALSGMEVTGCQAQADCCAIIAFVEDHQVQLRRNSSESRYDEWHNKREGRYYGRESW
jgi:hypothetical protein